MNKGSTATSDPGRDGREPRGVVVCVDDFGLHEGIDLACVRLAEQGQINAVSCMTAAPAWGPSSELEQLVQHRVSVGLHVDLTEHPTDRNVRFGLKPLIARAYTGQLDARAIAREIHAQCDRFEATVGHRPMHVDGHEHIHQFPVVRGVLLQALAERYRGDLPWLRSTVAGHAPATPWLKPRIIEALGARTFREQARRAGFGLSRRLLGVYDFTGGAIRYRLLLDRWMAAAEPGDVLMCHPAMPTERMDDLPAIWPARVAEYSVLSTRAGAVPL